MNAVNENLKSTLLHTYEKVSEHLSALFSFSQECCFYITYYSLSLKTVNARENFWNARCFVSSHD